MDNVDENCDHQFYNIGISERAVIGGTQDNGSWVMDGSGNTLKTGRSLGAVDGFSGDGGYSAISWLVLKIYFTEYQQGRIGRSETVVRLLPLSGMQDQVRRQVLDVHLNCTKTVRIL